MSPAELVATLPDDQREEAAQLVAEITGYLCRRWGLHAGGVLGVNRVALARHASLAAPWLPGDLDRRVAVAPQEPCEPDPVRPATLDSEHVNVAKGHRPGE